jgi:hypothetical protein
MTRRLRLATYNVDWFTELFDEDGAFLNNDSLSVRHDISKAQQFAAIGAVLAALDADAVMIIEGPDQSETRSAALALENFAAHFKLRACRALVGFTSNTRQEIVLIYDPEVMSVRHDPMGDADKSSAAPRFDFEYLYDLNGDGKINKREMTRIIDAFYDKRGINIEMRKDIKKEIDKMAKQEMRYFDKNGDDQIDMNEFIDGCVANLALYSPINIILNEMATNFFNISE